jgi:hypothetical protein
VTTPVHIIDEDNSEAEAQTWVCTLCENSVSTFVRLSSNPWCSNHLDGSVVMQLAE